MRSSVADMRGIHQHSIAETRSIKLSSRVDPRRMDSCSNSTKFVTVL